MRGVHVDHLLYVGAVGTAEILPPARRLSGALSGLFVCVPKVASSVSNVSIVKFMHEFMVSCMRCDPRMYVLLSYDRRQRMPDGKPDDILDTLVGQ
jgi:hypothetical protein